MNKIANTKHNTLKTLVAALLLMTLCILPFSLATQKSNATFGTPFSTRNQYPTGELTGGTVVDISNYSSGVDFDVMLEHGLSGVMLRAALNLTQDASLDRYYAEATARNIPVGVYHYVYWNRQADLASATQMAREEANFLLQTLRGKNIRGYVALDLEAPYDSQVKLSPADMTTVANTYMSILRSAGYKPLLYCNMNWITNHLQVNRVEAPLWLAYYKDTGSDEFPEDTYGQTLQSLSDRLVMWQYSAKGNQSYWGATTDLNHLYYSFTG